VIAGSAPTGLHADGRRVSTPVTTTDLFPTLLECASIGIPDAHASTVDASSLVGLLRADAAGAPPSADRGLAWHMPHQWGAKGPGIEPFTSWRRGPWKLLYFHDGPRIELYDLSADLGETNDLAEARPEIVRALLLELDAWIEASQAKLSTELATGRSIPRPATVADSMETTAP